LELKGTAGSDRFRIANAYIFSYLQKLKNNDLELKKNIFLK